MNDVYFICLDCKNYHDEGYRWCSAHLAQPGIIQLGQPVNVEAVLNADEYWAAEQQPEPEFEWLRRDLPSIRRFLEKHRTHSLFFDWAENFLWNEEELDWMDESDLAIADRSPRYFVERLGFTEWEQIEEHMQTTIGKDVTTWWYPEMTPGQKEAREKFEELVRQRRT